jgi:hypothetical protein
MPGTETTLLITAGATAVAASAGFVAGAFRRKKRTQPYTSEESAHVADTGVPPEALDLAKHPVTGEVTHRRRREQDTTPEPSPTPRVPAADLDDERVQPDALDTEISQFLSAYSDGAPDQQVRVPDHVPGSTAGAELPTSFSTDSWSEQLLTAHASSDISALAELAARHRPLAWVAHLLVLTLENDIDGKAVSEATYEHHLVDGYAALDDLEYVGILNEDPRLTEARTHLALRARLPLYQSVALVPCSPSGLRLAYAAHHLARHDSPTETDLESTTRDVQFAHHDDPYALTTLLLIDVARHLGTPVPAHSRRRDDQWGLLHSAARHHVAAFRDSPDRHAALADTRGRLDAAPAEDLRVDVDLLASTLDTNR